MRVTSAIFPRLGRVPTIQEAMDGPADNFSLLRFLFASAVIVSHGFSIPTGDSTLEPFYHTTGLRLGEYAVYFFFVISGFLVTMSFCNRGPRDYAVARALRIFPGFIVATLITVFVIGAAFTTLPLGAYLRNPELYHYLTQVLTGFKSAGKMPGVFADNPHPWPMGTVWTLKYELALYIAVLGFGVLGLLKNARVVGAVAASLFLAAILIDALAPHATRYWLVMLRLVLLFALGSFFYLARDVVRLSWFALLALLAMTWLSFGTAFYFALVCLTSGYGVLVFALGFQAPFVTLTDRADLSYGIYLYGYPVQQGLVALFPKASPWLLLAPALIISALIALVSWTLVEKPALHLKAVFARQRVRFAPKQGP